MSSPNQWAEPQRAYDSAWISPLREPAAKQALSRIPPTGYGPYWPLLLGRRLLRWRRRRTDSGRRRADSMTAWPDRKSAEDWQADARN